MRTVLRYGTNGLPLQLEETPGFLGLLTARGQEAIEDPRAGIFHSLADPIDSLPLGEISRGKGSACVVISDSTRPMPSGLVLPPILDTLEAAGIPRRSVTILIATGMHRPSTVEEKAGLVGRSIAADYKVVDHSARVEDNLVEVGLIAGRVPALVNRLYVEADLKILTGLIEPHMWAGFSGGRKSILPGLCGSETLKHMHGPEMIAHPGCEYGMLEGNPFHEAGLRVMAAAGADFIVNVTLDEARGMTGVFSGHPVRAHLAGCAYLSRFCTCELETPLDFIVTTNSGAPLDCNLYQTVKGMTGAAAVVREGGDIVIASLCRDGIGSPEYKRILDMARSPGSFLDSLKAGEFFIPDQWCAQEMYQVIAKRHVWIYADGVPPEDLRRYHLHPVASLEECIRRLLEKHGEGARWAVVPEGPMVILRLRGR